MDSFAQWFWLLIWWFLFFAYLVILFQIIGDLFRDHAPVSYTHLTLPTKA